MNKPFGTTCKAIAAACAIGIAVLIACVFDENARTYYPARTR